MATERTDDIILDVLYGEHDAESGEAVELNAEELAELEQWRRFRATLGRALPEVEPNPSVRASVMALAAAELSQSVDEVAGATVRRPPSQRESNRGFWSKLASGQGSQIALVATVLLVGAFVLNFLKVDSSMAPAYEEAGYPSASLPPQAAKQEPAPAPVEELEVAEVPAENVIANEEPAAASAPLLDGLEQPGAGEGAQGLGRTPKPKIKPTQRATAQRPEPRPSVSKRSIAKGASLAEEGFADSKSNTMPSTATRGAIPQPQEALDSMMEPAPSTTSMMAEKAKADVARDEDREAEPVAKKEVAAVAGTLDAVEEAYRQRDYRRVISQADSVIESGSSAIQRARALELKAQAYRQMGMLNQALTTYRNLEANYPTYQGDRVRASRLEIERQIESSSRPKERKQAAPSSYDFADDEVKPTSE